MYINNDTKSGNVGADAVVRDAGGTRVLSFRMANTSPFKDKTTTWWNVSHFGKNADTLASMVRKGATVVVVGSSYMREYTDKDGNKRFSPEFNASSVQVVNRAQNNSNDEEEAVDSDIDGLF